MLWEGIWLMYGNKHSWCVRKRSCPCHIFIILCLLWKNKKIKTEKFRTLNLIHSYSLLNLVQKWDNWLSTSQFLLNAIFLYDIFCPLKKLFWPYLKTFLVLQNNFWKQFYYIFVKQKCIKKCGVMSIYFLYFRIFTKNNFYLTSIQLFFKNYIL